MERFFDRDSDGGSKQESVQQRPRKEREVEVPDSKGPKEDVSNAENMSPRFIFFS